jgi:hypothetical protein
VAENPSKGSAATLKLDLPLTDRIKAAYVKHALESSVIMSELNLPALNVVLTYFRSKVLRSVQLNVILSICRLRVLLKPRGF